MLTAHALQYTHKGAGARIACIISYKMAKETTSMQCRGQLRHEVTKKVIKAAIKLCMHVTCYIRATLRTCLWNCPGAAQHGLLHLIHPIPLISSLEVTEMGPNWIGSEQVELRENTMRVRSALCSVPRLSELFPECSGKVFFYGDKIFSKKNVSLTFVFGSQ